jgi:hypothetical protein
MDIVFIVDGIHILVDVIITNSIPEIFVKLAIFFESDYENYSLSKIYVIP